MNHQINKTMFHYFAIYKPFDVLSQFTKEIHSHKTLSDLHNFPKAVYPVGRLDRDSEGLLLLTNDKGLTNQLLNPEHQHKRTYWVQVEGEPTSDALKQLRKGIQIRINKRNHQTLPATVKILTPQPLVPSRTPPIRERKNIPTTWIELTLTEGKNRQVRRMCAKVGFPVLRLIRTSIEYLELPSLDPGQVQTLEKQDVYKFLRIKAGK